MNLKSATEQAGSPGKAGSDAGGSGDLLAPWNLELNAAGITKGSGMRNLCQYLGIEAEETMAFGDGENRSAR